MITQFTLVRFWSIKIPAFGERQIMWVSSHLKEGFNPLIVDYIEQFNAR